MNQPPTFANQPPPFAPGLRPTPGATYTPAAAPPPVPGGGAPSVNRLPPSPSGGTPAVEPTTVRMNPLPGGSAEAPPPPAPRGNPTPGGPTTPGTPAVTEQILRVNPTPGADVSLEAAASATVAASAAPSTSEPAAPEVPPIPLSIFYTPSSNKDLIERCTYRPAPADHALYIARRALRFPNAANLPASVDLREYCGPVRDGGKENRGYAPVALIETLFHFAHKKALPGPLSARYVVLRSEGWSLADEIETITKWGACPERMVTDDASTTWTMADVAAKPFRLHDPVAVNIDQTTVKNVLASQSPVAVGLVVYDSFGKPGEGGVLVAPEFNEPVAGATAVLIVGYNETGWIVRGSFGAEWGLNGYAVMPYGYEATWTEAWTAMLG